MPGHPGRTGGINRAAGRRYAGVRHRQIGQVTGGTLQQAHHFDVPVRGHEELPPLLPVVGPADEGGDGLELPGGEAARAAWRQRRTQLAFEHRPARVVATLDGHVDRRVARVDHAQPARRIAIASGKEDRNVMHGLSPDHDRARDVVHGRHEPVRGADVSAGLEVEIRLEPKAPAPFPVAQAPGQTLRRIARFEVPGAELPRRSRVHEQGDRAVNPSPVIGSVDANRPGASGVVDDPGNPLSDAAGGGEQGDVDGGTAGLRACGRPGIRERRLVRRSKAGGLRVRACRPHRHRNRQREALEAKPTRS